MRQITTSVALAITLSMTAAASAEDCDLQRAHWVCVPNQEPGAIQQFLDRFRGGRGSCADPARWVAAGHRRAAGIGRRTRVWPGTVEEGDHR